jgi:hypothetical protein
MGFNSFGNWTAKLTGRSQVGEGVMVGFGVGVGVAVDGAVGDRVGEGFKVEVDVAVSDCVKVDVPGNVIVISVAISVAVAFIAANSRQELHPAKRMRQQAKKVKRFILIHCPPTCNINRLGIQRKKLKYLICKVETTLKNSHK